MDNTTWKREIMGLLMLPPERRETEVQKLLDLLKPKILCTNCGSDNTKLLYVQIGGTTIHEHMCHQCNKNFSLKT